MRNRTIVVLLVIAMVASAGMGYSIGNTNVKSAQLAYLAAENGNCTTPAHIPTTAPCFSYPAYVFNCPPPLTSGPAAPYTCSFDIKSTLGYPDYSVNITLGLTGQQTEPQWANCSWATSLENGYAECIPVINSTAFIVGVG
jgi:hypothetical protein